MKNCKYIGILAIFFGVFISAHATWAAKNFKGLEIYFTSKPQMPENFFGHSQFYPTLFEWISKYYIPAIETGLGYREVPGDSLRNVLRIMRGIHDAIQKKDRPLFDKKDQEFNKLWQDLTKGESDWPDIIASSEDIGDIADFTASMKKMGELNTKIYEPKKDSDATCGAKFARIEQIKQAFAGKLKAIQLADLLGVHIDDADYQRQLNKLFSVYNPDNAVLKQSDAVFQFGASPSEEALLKRPLMNNWSGFEKEMLQQDPSMAHYFAAIDKLAELRQTKYKIQPSGQVYKDKSKRIWEMGDQFTNILKKMRIAKIKNIDKKSWPLYVMQLDNLFSKHNPKNYILRQGKISGESLSDLDHSDSAKALLEKPWNDLVRAEILNTPEQKAQAFALLMKETYKLGQKETKEQLAARTKEDKYIHVLANCAVNEQCTDKIEEYLKSLEPKSAAAEVVREAQGEEGSYNPLQMLIASIKDPKLIKDSPAYFQLQRAIRTLVKYDNSKDPAVAKLQNYDDVAIVLDAMLAGDATIAGEMKRALAKVSNIKFLREWCSNNQGAVLPTDKNIRKSGRIPLSELCGAEMFRRPKAATEEN